MFLDSEYAQKLELLFNYFIALLFLVNYKLMIRYGQHRGLKYRAAWGTDLPFAR